MTLLPPPILLQTANVLLAYALTDLFPGLKLFKSFFTTTHFTCEFILPQSIDDTALALIEEKMKALSKDDLSIEKLDMMRENAKELFLYRKQPFKAEELEFSPFNIVQVFKVGKFYDLPSILLKEKEDFIFPPAFKLLSMEKITSFHKSSEENLEVLRINGTAACDKQMLKKFLKKLEAAKKRDPVELGKEMGLFVLDENSSSQELVFGPKGEFIKATLLGLLKTENQKLNFSSISTPSNKKSKAYFHALLYKSQKREKNVLPLRYSEIYQKLSDKRSLENEFLSLFDHFLSLTEISTIFCTKEEGVKEIIHSLITIDSVLKKLDLTPFYRLKKGESKKNGTIESFRDSALFLEKAMIELEIQFVLDKEVLNPYIKRSNDIESGPKIEVVVNDFLGREWVVSSLGIDIKTRETSSLVYEDDEGRKQSPLMIERVLFKSVELMMALLIEHYAGFFPLWLADTEVKILPIANRNQPYGEKVLNLLKEAGVRGEIDLTSAKLGEKIHRAESEKVPYMLIVGDQEEKSGTVKVRPWILERIQDKDSERVSLEAFLTDFGQKKSANLSLYK